MIGRIVKALRREGLTFFTRRFILMLQRVANYRSLLFFRIPAGHYSAAADPAVEEYRQDDERDNEVPWNPEAVSARLGAGHRMFILRVQGRPVSFAWVSESIAFTIDELDARVMIDRPMVWIWDCVTPDAFRGLGYYPRLLLALIARFEVDRIVIYCQSKNDASIKGIRKAGFAPWMNVAVTRWGIRIQQDGKFPGTFRVVRHVS
jgi:hypothetical protein